MATSQIVIYETKKVTPEKNFLVEDIDSYLSTVPSLAFGNFQYIKHSLELQIKVDLGQIAGVDQSIYDPFTDNGNFTYCRIKNSTDSRAVYYFIVDKIWTAQQTVTFTLVMDTVNTFQIGTDYLFDPKTKLIREHKDRIYNSTYTEGQQTYYRRKIDFEPEGIVPVKFKVEEEIISEWNSDYDWYIMYMANNEEQTDPEQIVPIDTYIMANKDLALKGSSTGYTLSGLSSSYIYYFGKSIDGTQTGQIIINGEIIDIGDIMSLTARDGTLTLKKATGAVQFVTNLCKMETVGEWTLSGTPITFYTSKPLVYFDYSRDTAIRTGVYSLFPSRILKESNGRTKSPTGTTENVSIDAMKTVDRTDTRILKMIMLPYCPFELTYENNTLVVPSYIQSGQVTFGTGASANTHQYLKLDPKKYGALENDVDNTIYPFENLFTVINDEDVRNDDNESKLFHSDFYEQRFVYDSFNYPIQLENMSKERVEATSPDDNLSLTQATTLTINSRFLFDLKNVNDYKTTSDYDHIVSVNRNNEVPLYNSDYINYIRTGYNYDKKIKNQTIAQGAFGILGGLVTGIGGGFGLGTQIASVNQTLGHMPKSNTFGEVPEYFNTAGLPTNKQLRQARRNEALQGGLPVVLAAGQLGAGISSIANSIFSITNAEESFNQKQEQMRMSSVSVAGSDDIDLLTYYSDNRAKICEYSVSDRMKENLSDLFYYYGYATQEQKAPELNTRKWFNYIQCEAVINNNKNLKQSFIDDLKARFATGVTILHKVNDSWDFDQVKANNESWLEA